MLHSVFVIIFVFQTLSLTTKLRKFSKTLELSIVQYQGYHTL